MRSRWDVLAAIFVGGCLGGLARYATVRAWPVEPGSFPWPTLAVNLSGALLLAVLLVFAGRVWQSRYARPLLGTGFCGAFTTFSAVVVDSDRLLASGSAGTALGYLAASFLGGLVVAFAGVVLARAVLDRRAGTGMAGEES
jgi:fluoride exporter